MPSIEFISKPKVSPRLINVLCDRALLVAFAAEEKTVKLKHVKQAIKELYPDQTKDQAKNLTKLWPLALVLIVLIALFYGYFTPKSTDHTTEALSPNEEITPVQPSYTLSLPSAAVSWQQYLNLWGEESSVIWNQEACPEISLIGMACMRKQGNINQIKQQNVPVLLVLDDGELALLKRLSGDQLILATVDGERPFNEADINHRWFWTLFHSLANGC